MYQLPRSGGYYRHKINKPDVYKRQIHKRVAALEHWGLEPLNGFLVTYTEEMEIEPYLAESWNVDSDTAVSYTHLDVYKRQSV